MFAKASVRRELERCVRPRLYADFLSFLQLVPSFLQPVPAAEGPH
ncbi:MAG TPA: hypothetical protein VM864_12095 [Pyrinomonadaceae bacterium]|nr:hypothetical protein [Pyrinomonadaceae bacterium]